MQNNHISDDSDEDISDGSSMEDVRDRDQNEEIDYDVNKQTDCPQQEPLITRKQTTFYDPN